MKSKPRLVVCEGCEELGNNVGEHGLCLECWDEENKSCVRCEITLAKGEGQSFILNDQFEPGEVLCGYCWGNVYDDLEERSRHPDIYSSDHDF
jgi:hypothetical protein